MVCLCRVSVGFVGDSWHAVLQGSMRTLNNVRHDLRARGQTSENLNHEIANATKSRLMFLSSF